MIKINVSTDNIPIKISSSNNTNSNISVSKSSYLGITEEDDPTVPQWAKEPEKPSYTAVEVGAVSLSSAMTNTEIEAIFK